jgi:hypothetical protein
MIPVAGKFITDDVLNHIIQNYSLTNDFGYITFHSTEDLLFFIEDVMQSLKDKHED